MAESRAAMIAPNGNTLVRVGSHRARHRLAEVIGADVQSWYSFYHSGYLAEVPPNKLADGTRAFLGRKIVIDKPKRVA